MAKSRIVDSICDFQQAFLYLLVIEIILFFLLLFSLVIRPESTAAWVVLQVDFLIVIPMILLVSGTLFLCRRRE